MKTPTLAVLTLLFTAGTTICQGKLGETEAQCVARYGPEFNVQDSLAFDVIGDSAASFHVRTEAGSFDMNVIFLNGAAALEKITSADPSHDISEDQKKAILSYESAGFEWSEKATLFHTDRSDATAGIQRWLRTDGATATCWMAGKLTVNHGWGEIDVSSRRYAAAQATLDQQNGVR